MRHTRSTPPQLCSAKDCDASLFFEPQTAWPDGLPAVAVNKLILAGWGQKLVFNHTIDVSEKAEIASLVRSLYFELSFGEVAHLVQKAKAHSWFPIAEVVRKFNMEPSAEFMTLADFFVQLPPGFQAWCIHRKISAHELMPLILAKDMALKPLYMKILNSGLTRTQGAAVLEFAVDLLLLGKTEDELHLTEKYLNESGHIWFDHVKNLRFPETTTKREWPGTSQARWAVRGTNLGLELKLFVSEPTDSKSIDLLEKGIFDTTKPN